MNQLKPLRKNSSSNERELIRSLPLEDTNKYSLETVIKQWCEAKHEREISGEERWNSSGCWPAMLPYETAVSEECIAWMVLKDKISASMSHSKLSLLRDNFTNRSLHVPLFQIINRTVLDLDMWVKTHNFVSHSGPSFSSNLSVLQTMECKGSWELKTKLYKLSRRLVLGVWFGFWTS